MHNGTNVDNPVGEESPAPAIDRWCGYRGRPRTKIGRNTSNRAHAGVLVQPKQTYAASNTSSSWANCPAAREIRCYSDHET